MFGSKARRILELQNQIEAMRKENGDLQTQVTALTERVHSYEERERSIARAMTEATAKAESVVSDAEQQANAIMEQSKADSDAARRDAERVVDTAYQNARDIVKEAENESKKRLDETQDQIETYVSILTGYDQLVQENIRAAQENAKKFAKLAQKLHGSIPQILSADGKLIQAPQPKKESAEDIIEEAAKAPEASSRETRGDGGEKLWTVSELSKFNENEASVDAIIDGVIDAG